MADGQISASRSGESNSAAHSTTRKRRRTRWNWALGIGLPILGVVGTLGAWFWPHLFEPPPPPPKPALYAVRVQVLDPQGRPVAGSTVRTSAGNEPHLLPDGWWQVEVPAAKLASDGRIFLRADHPDWEGSQMYLHLGTDPNPQVEIHLRQPETSLRGRVADKADRALSGVRVTRADGAPGAAITDADGHFELRVSAPTDTQLRVHAERAGLPPADAFCYAGRDSCALTLGDR